MRYLVLTLVVLALVGTLCWPVLRRLPRAPLVWTTVCLVALTAVFDSLIVGLGITVYAPETILGITLGPAPVEDFGYTLAVVMIVPTLWTVLGRSRSDPPGQWLRDVVVASRPYSWVNTAYPFAAGYVVATGGRIDAGLILGTLFFLVPYNLVMYGVNDVFDYASDLRNPRKGGIEGGLAPPEVAAVVHRRILVACAVAAGPFVVALLALGDLAANLTLLAVLGAVVGYSAPGLRLKERPVLDSMTSSAHFVGPLLYALVLVDADLGAPAVWPVLAAFFLWGMASHAFGAVQDVRADREGGIASVATALGAHAVVVGATVTYLASALLLLLVPWPGTLAALLPLPYAVNTARFWRVADADCERAHAGWRVFLVLNPVVGVLVTWLLIWLAVGARGRVGA